MSIIKETLRKEIIDQALKCVENPEIITSKYYNLMIKLIYSTLTENKKVYEEISKMEVEDKDGWVDTYTQKNHDINIVFVDLLKEHGFDFDQIPDEKRLEISTKIAKIFSDIYEHFKLGQLMLKYLVEK